MSLGIVLVIRADLGSSPWDVLHIGLYKQLGLTVGSWSIIAGIFVLTASSLLNKKIPQAGALLNMLLVGIFIDMYLFIPWLVTPSTLLGQLLMMVIGIIIAGYGTSFYIAANCGAGPRDSLMLALMKKTNIKVQWIRLFMEVTVLSIGWLLGGPVGVGTIMFSLTIGHVTGFTLPKCEMLAKRWIQTDQASVNQHV